MRRSARLPGMWLVAMTCAATAQGASWKEPELPAWGEGERQTFEESGWVAGALLLTDETIPDERGEEQAVASDAALDIAEPTADEIAETEDPNGEIPESFWPAYFEKRPDTFLVDPQDLLSPVDYRDRLAFLDYHASDSSIDLFVYLIKGGQEFPGEVREEELVERCFSSGRPAAVVFYFLGAPQRSTIALSPSLTDAVSSVEQRRALDSSVMQALEKTDPVDQFEAFLVQMSIRIYWMERMIGTERADSANELSPVVAKQASESEPSLAAKLEPYLHAVRPHLPMVFVMFSALITGCAANFVFRRKLRYRFPDFDVEPRLGGAHAAGIGAVISFASASLPPASQRDQVPDYLRRM